MKTMIESDEVTFLDIREAKLMRAQLAIQKQMSQKETYSVPVLVGDEVTNVTLKIVRGVEKKGTVDIMLETQLAGKIAATFHAKEKGISGMVATNHVKTKDEMFEHMKQFAEKLESEQLKDIDVTSVYMPDLNLNQFANSERKEAPEETDAYQTETSQLYHIAEVFIQTVKEIYQ